MEIEDKKKRRKMFVKIDAKGRDILNSGVMRFTMPKTGKWRELDTKTK